LKQRVFLRREAERLIANRTYTIYSKWIERVEAARPGDWVEVRDWRGELVGEGFYEGIGAVGVRVMHFEHEHLDPEVVMEERIEQAYRRRRHLARSWDGYRLVNADGDGLPGLVIDVYRRTAVLQSSSIGMDRYVSYVAEALVREGIAERVYIKNDHRGRREAGLPPYKGWAVGEGEPRESIAEADVIFNVDFEKGQKTGFFLDQRVNRINMTEFAQGRVLDLFTYTGGFAVHMLRAGAEEAVLVDESAYAVREAVGNLRANGLAGRAQVINARVEDVLEALLRRGERFDVVIADPPALIPSRELYGRGRAKYRRLYEDVFKVVSRGGLVFASSCSYFLSAEEFRQLLAEAAEAAGRSVVYIGGHWGISPDHVYRPVDRELNYLKAHLLEVE